MLGRTGGAFWQLPTLVLAAPLLAPGDAAQPPRPTPLLPGASLPTWVRCLLLPTAMCFWTKDEEDPPPPPRRAASPRTPAPAGSTTRTPAVARGSPSATPTALHAAAKLGQVSGTGRSGVHCTAARHRAAAVSGGG